MHETKHTVCVNNLCIFFQLNLFSYFLSSHLGKLLYDREDNLACSFQNRSYSASYVLLSFEPLYALIHFKIWPNWVARLLCLPLTFPIFWLGGKGSTAVIVTPGSTGVVPQMDKAKS